MTICIAHDRYVIRLPIPAYDTIMPRRIGGRRDRDAHLMVLLADHGHRILQPISFQPIPYILYVECDDAEIEVLIYNEDPLSRHTTDKLRSRNEGACGDRGEPPQDTLRAILNIPLRVDNGAIIGPVLLEDP